MKTREITWSHDLRLLFQAAADRPYPFILDSSLCNDGLGRYTFIGFDPLQIISGKNGRVLIRDRDGKQFVSEGSCWETFEAIWHPFSRNFDAAIPFTGGAVGFLSYDLNRELERLPNRSRDLHGFPDLHFGIYDGILVYDHLEKRLTAVAHGIEQPAETLLDRLETFCEKAKCAERRESVFQATHLQSNFTPEGYRQAVQTIRDYIRQGEVYQVNLSQHLTAHIEKGAPLDLFLRLRQTSPAPYSACLIHPEFAVVSSSPEQFIRKTGRDVCTRPIKGTRPRGKSEAEDALYCKQLRQSAKDRSELLMIVDLERNDLGKVAETGSVRVDGLFHLEKYSSVIHQTASVSARLRSDKTVFDCIRALFPGGSITGAPKIRAMEVIDELEGVRRGVYTGSVGYIDFSGNADFNIAIRTVQIKGSELSFNVGGGVVWDSEPEAEYQESWHKAAGILRAIGIPPYA